VINEGIASGPASPLDSEISGRLYDDGALATDPGDDRRPVFVVMTPAGLTLLASTPWSTSSRLWSALFGLAFMPTDVVELIRFNYACQVTIGLVGGGSITEPPAPAKTGPALDAQLSGNPLRRTRETEQNRRQNPGQQRSLTLVQQGIGEVVEGALAAVTPVTFTPVSIVVISPRIDVLALAPGTLEWTIVPPQRMDVDLTLGDVKELVDVREHRHG
jgi:hypothetical protein